MHASGASKSLMMNMHSSEIVGSMMDEMLACTKEKAEKGESLKGCTFISDMSPNKTSWIQEAPSGPGSRMMQPVFPSNDKSVVSITTS
jgi:hypothetical protein